MTRESAVRAARTACTNAENAGRQDTFIAAEKMGIQLRKRWDAAKDSRTRHEHGMADGQTVPANEPFIVGGEEMMFPGDTSGSPWNVYNCRCAMRSVEKEGIEAEPRQTRVRDPVTGKNVVVNDMTYSEWLEWKKAKSPEAVETEFKKTKNLSADTKQWKEYQKILGKDVPSTLDAFQNLKYNNSAGWTTLKSAKKQTAFVNDAECVTTPQKFTGYLLKPGAKHSQDFFDVGYSQDNPLQLRYDIAKNFDMSNAVDFGTGYNGARTFNVYMNLGITQQRSFLTGWIQDTPDDKPRIVTAFRKDKEEKNDK